MTAAPDPRCRVPWDFDRVAMDEAVWLWAGERLAAARESRLALAYASHAKAQQAIAGTIGGAMEARKAECETVPADEAGEYVLTAAEGIIQHLEQAGLFDWRQATAAAELARLYGIGGGRSAWRRTGGSERDEETVQRAREEFAKLLDAAPLCCRWPLTVLAMGEWHTAQNPVPIWQRGLDAIADRLGYAREP